MCLPHTSDVQVTLRLSAEAWGIVRARCLKDGLSQRAALQAAIECVQLFCLPEARRLAILDEFGASLREPTTVDPAVLARAVEQAWAEAAALTQAGVGDSSRARVSVPYPDGPLAELRAECLVPRSININAAVSSVFAPWGDDDEDIRDLRRFVWRWARRRGLSRDALRLAPDQVIPIGDGLCLAQVH